MATLNNFGVPVGGTRTGILMPKPKHKFRVLFNQFGPITGGLDISRNVVSVSRPTASAPPVTLHSYNSIAYYAGKTEWQEIELVVRDDVTNAVSALVGHQEQKQMNHFAQTTFLAGQDYKFTMFLETLDGGDDVVLERWFLEGCFLSQINWDQFDYSTAEPMQITMSIRYDNATQEGGLMPDNPEQSSPPTTTGVLA